MKGGEPTALSKISASSASARTAVSVAAKLRRVKAGDAKDCYAREPGNDLFE
jgi:hypothetical protein